MANIKEYIKKVMDGTVSLEEQQAALAQVEKTIVEAKQRRDESVGQKADMVVQALKTIEAKLEAKLVELNNTPAMQGVQGPTGKAGKDGVDGKDGLNGVSGQDGKDGKDGVDGKDGISVVDAKIDFDGSLVVYLSNGDEIDCGQILPPEVAQNIIISSGGSGTSQVVTDTLVSLQTQINTLTGIDGVLGTMAQQDANNVNITGGSITGVSGLGTVTSVAATAGTGISVTGSPITTSGTLNITNTAPDQIVAIASGTGISVTGTYPNFSVANTAPSSGGTVTSITAGTGLTGGTITSSGTIAIDSTVATLTGTQTLTNKRVTNRIGSNGGTTSGNITPTSDTADQYNITGLTGTSAIQIPSGTPTDAQRLSIRIKDNGTNRTLSWVTTAGGYRVIGTTLPLTTTANKTIYVGCVYNNADSFWDVVAVASEV
jgi:hypothetical protein